MIKGNSIKSSLIKSFTIGIALSFIIIFAVTFVIVKGDIQQLKQQSMSNLVEDAAKNISTQIDSMYATANTIAADPNIYTSATTFEEKKDRLIEYANARSINSIGYITAEGYLTSTDGFENDISTRDYYINLMKGINYISNPSFNTATQKQIIFIGVPIYENGKIVSSMTCTFDSSYMSNLISELSYFGQGEAFMLSNEGVFIASKDVDQVLEKVNYIKLGEDDDTYKAKAEVYQRMIENESGVENLEGDIIVYTKVPNTGGWTLAFKLPIKTYNSEVSNLIVIFIVFAIIGIVVVIILSIIIGTSLGNRLLKLKDNLSEVANGDFTVNLNKSELESKDEIGVIYQSVNSTLEKIGSTLIGIKKITDTLSNEATVLDDTSKQLSTGTNTVTTSMNEIQIGNTQQANEIENINSEMIIFNNNVEQVDTNIGGVVEKTTDATKMLQSSNKEMTDLRESFGTFYKNFEVFRTIIATMNESLSSINLITSTIGDIADQTNLLSLNASIEAARAGDVGKGFSVVAQEISKLAEQSASSIEDISNVVAGIMDSGKKLVGSTSEMGEQIQRQNDIISETLKSFDQLSEYMSDMLPQIEGISKISKDNLSASKRIGDSINNANAISEELVATANEVGSTSDEFKKSSNSVNDVAAEILELSDELSKLTSTFKIQK